MGELLLSTQMCQIKYISTSFFPNVEKELFVMAPNPVLTRFQMMVSFLFHSMTKNMTDHRVHFEESKYLK